MSAPSPAEKSLGELVTPGADDDSELIRHRFLCRGAGLLIVGPTHVGKSSLSLQCMISWALGRPTLDIEPTRPLSSLLIQAENDEGDLAQMRDGIVAGLRLTPAETQEALDGIMVVSEDFRTGTDFLEQAVRPAVKLYEPDIVWIDPVLAYLGGETISQKDVGAFLRNGLSWILRDFNCAGVLIHHTNKPTRERYEWRVSEMAYQASGSAEWANWSRATLAIETTDDPQQFVLCAAKRGRRLRWKEADGLTPCYRRAIMHAREEGAIYWQIAAPEVSPAASASTAKKKTIEDLLSHVPVDGSINKKVLEQRAKDAGIAEKRFRKVTALTGLRY